MQIQGTKTGNPGNKYLGAGFNPSQVKPKHALTSSSPNNIHTKGRNIHSTANQGGGGASVSDATSYLVYNQAF